MEDKKKENPPAEDHVDEINNTENENENVTTDNTDKLPVLVNRKVRTLLKNTHDTQAESNDSQEQNDNVLKIIPVKNIVLFPHNVLPFTAGKEWTSESLDKVMRIGGKIGILAQKDSVQDSPLGDDLYTWGTEAKILKIIRFPDNNYGAIIQGMRRFKVVGFIKNNVDELLAEVNYIEEETVQNDDLEIMAIGKAMKQLVQKAINLSPTIPNEASLFIENVQDPSYLADLIIPYLTIDFKSKQALLETESIETRLRQVHLFLTREIEILEISKKINVEVKSEMGKQQRKFFVKEQMKQLQKELGEIDGRTASGGAGDPIDLQEKIQESKMSKEAKEAGLREVERMNLMQPGSPEYMVSHTYVTWLLDLPWGTYSQKEINLKKAKEILDLDHHGLEKVKKRVLEFLAVCSLKNSLKGPIILFVGPPGVGKTSLGKSIAKALGRKFTRIALGGVRDEAEIRGHRRTYIGSMPGKIADALKKSGTMDPVILFDEIDKLAHDGRGDPASALLEVLDPEQNNTFTDHYLNLPLDLSKVFFIATANNLYSIPAPLRDRMEVVELSSYTLDEKSHIAYEHLLPQVLDDHGIKGLVDLKISNENMKNIVHQYTREAGVRQLKRELAGISRGIARECVEKGIFSPSETMDSPVPMRSLTMEDIKNFLGPALFLERKKPKDLPVGVATGLAWTPNGGDVLFIETAVSTPGSGKFVLTGQLGDVMKESVQTAFAFIRSNPKLCNVDNKILLKKDLHIHFPEGAVKKDGPSAGVAAFLGMISQFTGRPLPADLAMTGEISLRGEVLPVGGVKEKLLAAHRYGIKTVMIPNENERDLSEIPQTVLSEMKVILMDNLQHVLSIVFPKQNKKANVRAKVIKKPARSSVTRAR